MERSNDPNAAVKSNKDSRGTRSINKAEGIWSMSKMKVNSRVCCFENGAV
jgi:hypothetical protein